MHIPTKDVCCSPRTVSIALTNRCDLKCHFCYAPKSRHELPLEYVKDLCLELDRLGVLEVTFGGGEPTLHPHFEQICSWVWDHTSLGISFTTHGHHLTPELIKRLATKVSSIRFSIDGVEPTYSVIRGRALSRLQEIMHHVKGKVHFGINTVVSPIKSRDLESVITLSMQMGADNLLIIPEHKQGRFLLEDEDWKEVERLIALYRGHIELLVTDGASSFLQAETLGIASEDEFLFAHISADRQLKVNSYDRDGIHINEIEKLHYYFFQLYSSLL